MHKKKHHSKGEVPHPMLHGHHEGMHEPEGHLMKAKGHVKKKKAVKKAPAKHHSKHKAK